MRIKKRVLAGAIAAGLALSALTGGSAAVAADLRYSAQGFPSMSACEYSKNTYIAHFKRKGYVLYAGDGCGWWGSSKKYGFSLLFR